MWRWRLGEPPESYTKAVKLFSAFLVLFIKFYCHYLHIRNGFARYILSEPSLDWGTTNPARPKSSRRLAFVFRRMRCYGRIDMHLCLVTLCLVTLASRLLPTSVCGPIDREKVFCPLVLKLLRLNCFDLFWSHASAPVHFLHRSCSVPSPAILQDTRFCVVNKTLGTLSGLGGLRAIRVSVRASLLLNVISLW